MLTIPTTPADDFVMDMRHHCAEDPATGAYLSRSYFKSHCHSRERFYLHIPGRVLPQIIMAWSLQEAITLANSYLAGVVTDESRH